MASRTRIVVTGAGIISALGAGCRPTLDALRNNRSGIGRMRHLATVHDALPAGEVDMDERELRAAAGVDAGKAISRTSLLGIIALKEALAQARMLDSRPAGTALVSGTTVGGMEKTELYYNDFLTEDSRNEYIPLHDCGASTDAIADRFGGFDLVTTLSTACSSAANAIAAGADMLLTGRATAVAAGGSECLTRFHLNGFNTLMILDGKPCRPFDASRAGLNLGEGAAFLILETEQAAAARGAEPLCVLSGWGNACDAFHQTASSPEGEGAYRSMSAALAMSGLQPSQIDYINAHGTGTPNNDLSEGRAIMRLFGDNIPPISSTKSATGHTTSASGAIEAVISMLALRHDFTPANLRFAEQVEGIGFKPVTDASAHHRPLRHVLSNSFGFGGNDSSIILSKYL